MAKGLPKLPPKTPAQPPSGGLQTPQQFGWLGPLGRLLDRFLSSPGAADPLYMSNRTFGQKIRGFAMWGAPILVAAGLLIAFSGGYFNSGAPVQQGPFSD